MSTEPELHRIVHTRAEVVDNGSMQLPPMWRVDSLQRPRPSRMFTSRQNAEAYLTEHNAEYLAETGKWHGGTFEEIS